MSFKSLCLLTRYYTLMALSEKKISLLSHKRPTPCDNSNIINFHSKQALFQKYTGVCCYYNVITSRFEEKFICVVITRIFI